jgi:hypothetical protein
MRPTQSNTSRSSEWRPEPDGSGLSRTSGKASKAGTLTVKLTLTNAEAAFLARHHGRRLKVKIKLQFTPKKGAKLKTTTTVLIG